MTAPTIGRIVHYRLSEQDAGAINHQRQFGLADVFVGNHASAGDVYPAMVVRVFPGGTEVNGVCNLQVFLDGNDVYWATSRVEGDAPGSWSWPPRAS